ncbi:unnamed protein product [Protopolystoma xenopodis]|uniref:Uncharacterized protein n=1 Tax=Protopolystoma xenopodis TaxID=117903 RepID=A0A448WVY2_9PLAT|nr:unnamed protein product [Protopolystoma xenopodis]
MTDCKRADTIQLNKAVLVLPWPQCMYECRRNKTDPITGTHSASGVGNCHVSRRQRYTHSRRLYANVHIFAAAQLLGSLIEATAHLSLLIRSRPISRLTRWKRLKCYAYATISQLDGYACLSDVSLFGGCAENCWSVSNSCASNHAPHPPTLSGLL